MLVACIICQSRQQRHALTRVHWLAMCLARRKIIEEHFAARLGVPCMRVLSPNLSGLTLRSVMSHAHACGPHYKEVGRTANGDALCGPDLCMSCQGTVTQEEHRIVHHQQRHVVAGCGLSLDSPVWRVQACAPNDIKQRHIRLQGT